MVNVGELHRRARWRDRLTTEFGAAHLALNHTLYFTDDFGVVFCLCRSVAWLVGDIIEEAVVELD